MGGGPSSDPDVSEGAKGGAPQGCSGSEGLMIRILAASAAISVIAVLMSMVGRGGGNFYVPLLIAAGASMHEAATTAQLILMATAAAAAVVFQRYKAVDWKLALVIDPPTDAMAFVGGICAHRFTSSSLKLVFAFLLVMASFLMLRPVRERERELKNRFGYWHRSFGGYRYVINLWLVLPITAATGFVAGMVGISGGSFKIPLMVLAGGVPMRIAVGTSSVMVAVTALTGFLGHTLAGDLNLRWALPTAASAVVGGLIGGRISVKVDPKRLKHIFAYTTLLAAVFMTLNAFLSK